MRSRVPSVAAGLLVAVLQGCVRFGPGAADTRAVAPSAGPGPAAGSGSTSGDSGSGFAGTVSGPATLIGNTGAALIGNTGAALVGNTGAALVGNTGAALVDTTGGSLVGHAGGFGIQGLAQTALPRAVVYLTNPDESFYAQDGKILAGTTDSAGHYRIPANLPPDYPVFVNAVLAKNRRLVGYARSGPGTTTVNIDLATTYVLELLRSEARRSGKTFARYDLGSLERLVDRTRELFATDRLGLKPDDLIIGRSESLADTLSVALSRAAPDLLAQWKPTLGAAPVALLTFAGTYGWGISGPGRTRALESPIATPYGIATWRDESYVGMFELHQISAIDASGSMGPVSARSASDPSGEPPPPIPESGSPADSVRIPQPAALGTDTDGNLFVVMNSPVDRPRNLVLMLCRTPGPRFGLPDLLAGRWYRVAGTPDPRFDDTGFNLPAGLATDAAGNLFVADQGNHRIVRVDRQSGRMERVAGASTGRGFGRVVDGERPALGSPLTLPSSVAWRQSGADQELFILDGLNQRVRVATAPGGDWQRATMRTLAGAGTPVEALGRWVVPGGFSGDGASAPEALFAFARADTAEPESSDLPLSQLVVDPRRERLYVADTLNHRVRAIDLRGGTVSTLAGGGSDAREARAWRAEMEAPTGLALLDDDWLLITDPARHVVRSLRLGD